MIALAKKLAVDKDDGRNQRHGCVGVRKDGVIVASCNGHQRNPSVPHHAEARVLRKLGKGGILYVVRVLPDGKLGNSTPCTKCQKLIKAYKVSKVIYSASDGSLLVWRPSSQSRPKSGSYSLTADTTDQFQAHTWDVGTAGFDAWLPQDGTSIGCIRSLDTQRQAGTSFSVPQAPVGLGITQIYGPLKFADDIKRMSTWDMADINTSTYEQFAALRDEYQARIVAKNPAYVREKSVNESAKPEYRAAAAAYVAESMKGF